MVFWHKDLMEHGFNVSHHCIFVGAKPEQHANKRMFEIRSLMDRVIQRYIVVYSSAIKQHACLVRLVDVLDGVMWYVPGHSYSSCIFFEFHGVTLSNKRVGFRLIFLTSRASSFNKRLLRYFSLLSANGQLS